MMTDGDVTRAAPGIDVAPPVTPNLVAHPGVPGRGRIGQNIVETLIFRGLASPVALVLVVLQSRFLHPEGRGAFVLLVLSVTIFSRLRGQLGLAALGPVRHGEPELPEQAREDRHRQDEEYERAAALRVEEAALEHDEHERDRAREPAEDQRLDDVLTDPAAP